MKNKAPIFINAFARGGSNILWNLLQSHPNVCSPIYETHEIFCDGMNRKILWALGAQPGLFDIYDLSPRKRISMPARYYIDWQLLKAKLKNYEHEYNKWKSESEKYTYDELANSRLISKNLNGIILLTDTLLEMYPDATFVALVRDGFALCEGYLRHGLVSTASDFADVYNRITGKMIQDSKAISKYKIIRFEDILDSPVETIEKIYSFAELDIHDLEKVRLKAKPHFNKEGVRVTEYARGEKVWLSYINRYQADRLSRQDKEEFLSLARNRMELFSYI
jgi:hypothetical protein